MIVIILVKCAAKSGFFPVQCAVMTIDFFGGMCYDIKTTRSLKASKKEFV
jgi:hypothetical protein